LDRTLRISSRLVGGSRRTADAATSLEKREHGKHPPVAAGFIEDAEFVQQITDVTFDRPFGKPKATGDGRVGQALGHEREHRLLALGESREYTVVAVGGDELSDDLGV
jgi:hypothetical protein